MSSAPASSCLVNAATRSRHCPHPTWSLGRCFTAATLPWLPLPLVSFPGLWTSRWPLLTGSALLGQGHTQPSQGRLPSPDHGSSHFLLGDQRLHAQDHEPGRMLLASHRPEGLSWNELPGLRGPSYPVATKGAGSGAPASSLPQGSPCRKASKSHRLSRGTTSFPRGNLCRDATVTTVPPAPAPSSQRLIGGCLTAGTLAVDRGGVQFPGGLPGCVGRGGGGEVCLSRAVSWESQCWAHLTQARRGVDTGVAQKGTRTAGRGM